MLWGGGIVEPLPFLAIMQIALEAISEHLTKKMFWDAQVDRS